MATTASPRLAAFLATATLAFPGCSASTSHTTSLAELQREGAKLELTWTAGSLIVHFTGMPSRSNDCLVLDPSQLTVRIDGATTTPSTGPRSTVASIQPLGGSFYLPPPTAGCETPSAMFDLSAAVALVPHAGVVDILLADGSATAHFQVDGLATPLALAPARPGPFKRGARMTLSLTPASATIKAAPVGWRRGAASLVTPASAVSFDGHDVSFELPKDVEAGELSVTMTNPFLSLPVVECELFAGCVALRYADDVDVTFALAP